MEEYRTYLLKYEKGEEKLNRIYAAPKKFDESFFINLKDFAQKNKNETLENIALSVELEYLEDEKFILLKGIKGNLNSYKSIIKDIYTINISK